MVRFFGMGRESDLALQLADYLRRPTEAMKAIANILDFPGDIRVTDKSITIALELIGRKDELKAATHLLNEINRRKFTLPGDPNSRPLRFKSKNLKLLRGRNSGGR